MPPGYWPSCWEDEFDALILCTKLTYFFMTVTALMKPSTKFRRLRVMCIRNTAAPWCA
jgi:hypothetical protein